MTPLERKEDENAKRSKVTKRLVTMEGGTKDKCLRLQIVIFELFEKEMGDIHRAYGVYRYTVRGRCLWPRRDRVPSSLLEACM